jgi:hypothetical protein
MPKKELHFSIEGTTPHTFPMARLADYLRELATLLGNEDDSQEPCGVSGNHRKECRRLAVAAQTLYRQQRRAVRLKGSDPELENSRTGLRARRGVAGWLF